MLLFSLKGGSNFDLGLLAKYRQVKTALCGYESGRKGLVGEACIENIKPTNS